MIIELISKQAALSLAKDVVLEGGAKHRCIDSTMLHELPTVDAEPVRHGKWLPESADIPSICSVCGEDWDSFVFGDGLWYHGNLPKYCPHCGAKMDRRKE